MKINVENALIIDPLLCKVCAKEFPIGTDVNSINNHNCDSSYEVNDCFSEIIEISNDTSMYLKEVSSISLDLDGGDNSKSNKILTSTQIQSRPSPKKTDRRRNNLFSSAEADSDGRNLAEISTDIDNIGIEANEMHRKFETNDHCYAFHLEQQQQQQHLHSEQLDNSKWKENYSFFDKIDDNNVTTNLKDISFQCHVCEEEFDEFNMLKEHIIIHPYFYDCNNCGASFNIMQHLMNHVCKYVEKQYKCDYCPKRFHFKFGVEDHHAFVHETQAIYVCNICKLVFESSAELKTHQEITLNSLRLCKRCGVLYHIDNLNEHKIDCFKKLLCIECKRLFKSEKKLNQHKEKCHPKVNNYLSSSADEIISPIINDNKENNNALNNFAIKKFKCKLCNKKYMSTTTLYSHIKLEHEKQSNYQCILCKKCLLSASHLAKHLIRHAGERLHKCARCTKTFKDIKTLRLHEIVHKKNK